jgi:NADH-quinone oxidoreductase subunit N
VNVDFSTWMVLAPILAACGWGMVVLVAEMFATNRRFTGIGWLTIIALVDIAVTTAWVGSGGDSFTGAIVLDGFAAYFNYLICGIGVVAILMSIDYLPKIGIVRGEYYPLIVFAVVGLMAMAAATDLIVMFLGLETMSMAVYVLAGIRKHELRSNEAALKYFLMGAFASAILLYGVALIYLVCGTTGLAGIAASLASTPLSAPDTLVLQLGVGLLLIGFGFKVAAVPFHLWAPDVYEGAPTSVTAFMATAVKAGAFAALVRIFVVALAPLHEAMWPMLWIGSAATMTIGNFVALQQTSLKRMLAYSSIAHTGYLLVGITAATSAAGSSVLFYLAAYGAMNLGAFGVMIALARRDHGYEQISNLAGLGQSRPMLALVMTVCLLSLLGMPPLAGFVGKFYLFSAALDAGFVGLVVIAVLNSVVSAAYYLGVVRTMYFDAPSTEPTPLLTGHAAAGLVVAVVATVLLGIAPAAVLGAAERAMRLIVLGG